MNHCYAFRIQSGKEFTAERILWERHGVTQLNPCAYRYLRKQPNGPLVLNATPMLRGYYVGLFTPECLAGALSERWPDGSRILSRPLSTDSTIRPLSAETRLQIIGLNAYTQIAPEIERKGVKPGDLVILKGGVHNGKRFRLQSVSSNSKRARAVLEILGSLRDVEISTDAVEIVKAA